MHSDEYMEMSNMPDIYDKIRFLKKGDNLINSVTLNDDIKVLLTKNMAVKYGIPKEQFKNGLYMMIHGVILFALYDQKNNVSFEEELINTFRCTDKYGYAYKDKVKLQFLNEDDKYYIIMCTSEED